ncbi:hypothetical protein [Micromonospora sp. CPCC 206061]|uniref:hypothetical protein n=1 Tax=Micromonospora sp. CPCC 206061 TaxID=3122410 RepID=UPI002FF19711
MSARMTTLMVTSAIRGTRGADRPRAVGDDDPSGNASEAEQPARAVEALRARIEKVHWGRSHVYDLDRVIGGD